MKFKRKNAPNENTWWTTSWFPESGGFIEDQYACIVRLRNGKRLCIIRRAKEGEPHDFSTACDFRYMALAYPETLPAAKVAFQLLASGE